MGCPLRGHLFKFMNELKIGEIVFYTLSTDDADQISRRRTTSNEVAELIKANAWPLGAQAHVGTCVAPGDVVPMIVVAIGYNNINGQAFLDGADTLWVQGATEGNDRHQWSRI